MAIVVGLVLPLAGCILAEAAAFEGLAVEGLAADAVVGAELGAAAGAEMAFGGIELRAAAGLLEETSRWSGRRVSPV